MASFCIPDIISTMRKRTKNSSKDLQILKDDGDFGRIVRCVDFFLESQRRLSDVWTRAITFFAVISGILSSTSSRSSFELCWFADVNDILSSSKKWSNPREIRQKKTHRPAYRKLIADFYFRWAVSLDYSLNSHIEVDDRFSFSKSNQGEMNTFYQCAVGSVTSRTAGATGGFLCTRAPIFSEATDSLRWRSLSRRPRDTALYPELDMVSESFRIRGISTAAREKNRTTVVGRRGKDHSRLYRRGGIDPDAVAGSESDRTLLTWRHDQFVSLYHWCSRFPNEWLE